VTSPHGGDVEVKFEPLTGELVGLVVIELPETSLSMVDGGDRVTEAAVRIDTAPWVPSPDGVPTRALVREERAMRAIERPNGIELTLEDVPVDFWAMTQGVGVGISDELNVVALRIPRSAR
jgi:hypothetical protein